MYINSSWRLSRLCNTIYPSQVIVHSQDPASGRRIIREPRYCPAARPYVHRLHATARRDNVIDRSYAIIVTRPFCTPSSSLWQLPRICVLIRPGGSTYVGISGMYQPSAALVTSVTAKPIDEHSICGRT